MFEAAWGCFENTEEFHVRLDKSMVESGGSLRGYPAGVRSLRMSSSSCRLCSRWTLDGRPDENIRFAVLEKLVQ